MRTINRTHLEKYVDKISINRAMSSMVCNGCIFYQKYRVLMIRDHYFQYRKINEFKPMEGYSLLPDGKFQNVKDAILKAIEDIKKYGDHIPDSSDVWKVDDKVLKANKKPRLGLMAVELGKQFIVVTRKDRRENFLHRFRNTEFKWD